LQDLTVRSSTLVMIAVAVLFGLLAVFVAQAWLNNQADARMRSFDAQKRPVTTRTIVVAARPLRFGAELTVDAVREVPWTAEALPAGAFAQISELLQGGKRVVLTAIEPNEPVLAIKVTGAGQRATLSALVGEGMKAVTIRVNDVEGVGGFVLPGDRVDVVMTQQSDKGSASTQVVLQNTRVLAIDQVADERAANPTVAKAVTLEVNMIDAQKLWLAASVGNLSLLLRKAGETAAANTRRVTMKDLSDDASAPRDDGGVAKVVVTRGGQKQEYGVPAEGHR
jgi:pilus assembly protein CpaB